MNHPAGKQGGSEKGHTGSTGQVNVGTYSGTNLERQAQSYARNKKFEASTSYLDVEVERDSRIRELGLATSLSFAYGRLRFVNAHLALRHGGPCRTDDGVVYSDLMLPFAVEISHLDRTSSFALALRRFRYWMPAHVAEIGESGLADQWNELSEMRSIAKAHNRSEAKAGNILWLPTAERIRTELRPTSAERDALNALYPDHPPARGVGVIDPPTEVEARERKRQAKEAERRSKGVVPMATRTKTAERIALAARIGCSAKTLQRCEAAGTIDAFLRERGVNVQNVSPRYILESTQRQVLDIEPDPRSEAMKMFRDMLNEPYADTWPEMVL